MYDTAGLYNNVAPLRNVAALLALIERLTDRPFGLPGMATFYGPSGYGKTTSATYSINRYNSCHVEAKALWSTKTLLVEIVKELGLKPERTQPALFDQAAQNLGETGRPLLLDEADHLMKDRMIEVVRGLHEASGTPVILIGEEGLPQALRKWERVHGRMLDWVAVQPATAEDVTHLARIYCAGIEVTPELAQKVLIAARHSIRRVSINLSLIREDALRKGLTRMRPEDFDGKFFTGEAPAPRRIA